MGVQKTKIYFVVDVSKFFFFLENGNRRRARLAGERDDKKHGRMMRKVQTSHEDVLKVL